MRSRQVIVMLDLEEYGLRFLYRRNRDASYTDVDVAAAVYTFVVIHQGKVIIRGETQLILGCFKCFVGRHIILSITFEVTEVERSPAEQSQILQLSRATTIHHPDKVANARRVGGACRKLVINLVHIHHYAGQIILRSMIVGQLLSLLEENGRSENQVIGRSDGMKVLIGQCRPIYNRIC